VVDLDAEPVSPKVDQPQHSAPQQHTGSRFRKRTDAEQQAPQQLRAHGDDAQRKRAFQRLLGDGTSKDAQVGEHITQTLDRVYLFCIRIW